MRSFRSIPMLLFFFAMNTPAAQAKTVDFRPCFQMVIARYREVEHKPKEFIKKVSDNIETCLGDTRILRMSDEVIFSDGRHFVLGERLGEGELNVTWAVRGDRHMAIRIPKGTVLGFYHMERFLEGWKRLKKFNVPAIEILDPENTSLEYHLVERVEVELTLPNWRRKILDPSVRLGFKKKSLFVAGLEALPTFADKTAIFSQLGGGLQMAFDGEEWRLYDFDVDNILFTAKTTWRRAMKTTDKETIWDGELGGGPLEQELKARTLKTRARLCDVILASKLQRIGPL